MADPQGDNRRRADPLTQGLDYLVRRNYERREKIIAEIQANGAANTLFRRGYSSGR